VEEGGECSLLLPGVDSSGNGTATGASAAAHSPALPLLPQIIGLPTTLHARTKEH
jgi:hypothetical protein